MSCPCFGGGCEQCRCWGSPIARAIVASVVRLAAVAASAQHDWLRARRLFDLAGEIDPAGLSPL